jgi:hypothetical protein
MKDVLQAAALALLIFGMTVGLMSVTSLEQEGSATERETVLQQFVLFQQERSTN